MFSKENFADGFGGAPSSRWSRIALNFWRMPRPSRHQFNSKTGGTERILLPLMNTPAKQRFPRDDGAGTYSGGRLYPTLQSAYSRSGPNSRALLISSRPAPRAR